MAYPASTITLDQLLKNADGAALRIKFQVQELRSLSSAGVTGRSRYLNIAQQITSALATWADATARSGIAAYAQTQKGNASLNVAAEFTAMRTAAENLRAGILSAFPKDGNGNFLVYSHDGNGNQTELTFTAVETAGFRTLADALIAAIE